MPTLNHWINEIENCVSVDELSNTLQKIISSYGFASYAFIDTTRPGCESSLLITTHSPQWIDTYLAEELVKFDPCLALSQRTNCIFNWGSISPPYTTGKKKPGAIKVMN